MIYPPAGWMLFQPVFVQAPCNFSVRQNWGEGKKVVPLLGRGYLVEGGLTAKDLVGLFVSNSRVNCPPAHRMKRL
ncbi:MAG TPA: hypothetical protein DCY42_05400 [Chloroflexi bacterium]|nr:hypothetical protein [Chloroflexota bacterium]